MPGGFEVPSPGGRMDGGSVLGQYRRITRWIGRQTWWWRNEDLEEADTVEIVELRLLGICGVVWQAGAATQQQADGEGSS